MAKLLRSLLRRTLHGARGNLVSLDDPFAEMARLLPPGRVRGFVDGGAAHGRITRRLLKHFPAAGAWLFEANPDFGPALSRLAANDSRIQYELVALGDREGTVTLHRTAQSGQSSLFRPGDSVAVVDELAVPLVTLDAWWRRQGCPPIDLVKLDIQAGELAALRGARDLLDAVAIIYTEILFNPLYEGGAIYSQVDLCLRECGFQLYNIYKPRADGGGMLAWADAIFLHPQRVLEAQAA